jgi:hypothetical protein
MKPERLEEFAMRCALGNNGGAWATHYTEDQKAHWRKFVSELYSALEDEAVEAYKEDQRLANGGY